MANYFEGHVTTHTPESVEQREAFERLAKELGWKTSEIARDPVLGSKTFFYFTAHTKEFDPLKVRMDTLARSLGDVVIRQKIEHVVFDTKVAVDPGVPKLPPRIDWAGSGVVNGIDTKGRRVFNQDGSVADAVAFKDAFGHDPT